MSGRVYFNDNDPAAAHVLGALMDEGFLPRGVVDARSIKDVQPDDLKGFEQCHFFAGFGGWSIAARAAGWPDDRPLWTGSCPCQPFSQAGRRAGAADARHLWPDFFRLIAAARPAVVVGEQVAGKAGNSWFDGIAADLGGEDYAFRAVDIPAAAVDAPHIRQRLYWIALANADGCGRAGWTQDAEWSAFGGNFTEWPACGVSLGDAECARLEGHCWNGVGASGRPEPYRSVATPNGGFWSDAEWIACYDGKARRAKPGIRLLVDGVPGRIDGWRLAGNGLVIPLATQVVAALMDCIDGVAREHSRKPEEFYDLIRKASPGLSRADLFSRETRDGFYGWGIEHRKFDKEAA